MAAQEMTDTPHSQYSSGAQSSGVRFHTARPSSARINLILLRAPRYM